MLTFAKKKVMDIKREIFDLPLGDLSSNDLDEALWL